MPCIRVIHSSGENFDFVAAVVKALKLNPEFDVAALTPGEIRLFGVSKNDGVFKKPSIMLVIDNADGFYKTFAEQITEFAPHAPQIIISREEYNVISQEKPGPLKAEKLDKLRELLNKVLTPPSVQRASPPATRQNLLKHLRHH